MISCRGWANEGRIKYRLSRCCFSLSVSRIPLSPFSLLYRLCSNSTSTCPRRTKRDEKKEQRSSRKEEEERNERTRRKKEQLCVFLLATTSTFSFSLSFSLPLLLTALSLLSSIPPCPFVFLCPFHVVHACTECRRLCGGKHSRRNATWYTLKRERGGSP